MHKLTEQLSSGGCGPIAGPLGRQADAGVTLGRRGAALCYSYSLTRGAYAGAPSSELLCMPCASPPRRPCHRLVLRCAI